MKIEKLTVGQTVYSIESQTLGNTTIRRRACFTVRIIEINLVGTGSGPWVLASWNGNAPRKFYQKTVSKWKVVKPQPKSTTFGLSSY